MTNIQQPERTRLPALREASASVVVTSLAQVKVAADFIPA
jgi:hypothetical protein